MIIIEPRSHTVYNMGGFELYDDLLKKSGKHTSSKGCLYINRLDDIDLPTLIPAKVMCGLNRLIELSHAIRLFVIH